MRRQRKKKDWGSKKRLRIQRKEVRNEVIVDHLILFFIQIFFEKTILTDWDYVDFFWAPEPFIFLVLSYVWCKIYFFQFQLQSVSIKLQIYYEQVISFFPYRWFCWVLHFILVFWLQVISVFSDEEFAWNVVLFSSNLLVFFAWFYCILGSSHDESGFW